MFNTTRRSGLYLSSQVNNRTAAGKAVLPFPAKIILPDREKIGSVE